MYVCTYVFFVCAYVCVHACMYVCMHTNMYVCVCACMYVCMHAHTYMYACMYTYLDTHISRHQKHLLLEHTIGDSRIHACVRVFVCVCACVWFYAQPKSKFTDAKPQFLYHNPSRSFYRALAFSFAHI